MNEGTGFDYADLIERVLRDDVAMTYFVDHWYRIAPTVFDLRERMPGKLRVSDAGTCRLALWADVHNRFDLPEDVNAVDDKMQPGIIDGARSAYLIAAGIKRWYWPLTVTIEQRIDAWNTPGHADLIVWAEPEPIEVVECKMTLYTKPIADPKDRHDYWLHQACRYALGVGAPHFVVLVHAPGVWNGPTRASFRDSTAEWATKTDHEYARLADALDDTAPEPDRGIADTRPEWIDAGGERWRCKSCRYSQCGNNENPAKPTVDTIVDELARL